MLRFQDSLNHHKVGQLSDLAVEIVGRDLTEEVTRWVKQVGARYLVVLG